MTSQVDQEAWERARQLAATIPAIPLQAFLARMSYVMMMVADWVDIHQHVTRQLVERHVNGQMQLLEDNPQLLRVNTAEALHQIRSQIEQGVRDQIGRYPAWVLNQALVSHCTLLDAFLEETVELLLRNRPSLLYDSPAGREVTLQQVIEHGAPAVLLEVARKEATRFAHLTGIKARIGYLDSKLALRTADLFDWSYFTDFDRFTHWDLEYLSDVYDQRNQVVHHDQYSVTSVQHLHEISTAFSKLMLNIVRAAGDEYGITNDMNRTLIQAQHYHRLLAESQPQA